MIIIDTNVISELMRPRVDKNVISWMNKQSPFMLYTTSITEAEVRYGATILPQGKRKTQLFNEINDVFAVDFIDRILSFDSTAAALYATLAAHRRSIGRPINHMDAQIAAIATSRGAAIATRNTDDFADCGLDLINPWTDQ